MTQVGDGAFECVNLAAFFRRGESVPNRLCSSQCHKVDLRLGGASIPVVLMSPRYGGSTSLYAIARPAVTPADLVDLYCDPGLIRSIVDSPSPRKARPVLAGLSIRSVRSKTTSARLLYLGWGAGRPGKTLAFSKSRTYSVYAVCQSRRRDQ